VVAEDLFPDLDLEPWGLLSPAAAVAMHGFAIGANGDLEGFPTARRPADFTGMSVIRYADDRVLETWDRWDTVGFLTQVGLSPEMLAQA
jgi:hypothetical protein